MVRGSGTTSAVHPRDLHQERAELMAILMHMNGEAFVRNDEMWSLYERRKE